MKAENRQHFIDSWDEEVKHFYLLINSANQEQGDRIREIIIELRTMIPRIADNIKFNEERF